MKEYPSIPKKTKIENPELYIFSKLDGSNLRFEWNKKQGFYKFGTRHHLFDANDETFGDAVEIFMNNLAEPISKISSQKKWESVVVFCEYWGEHSFAGKHYDEPKQLTLFDVAPYKKNFIPPQEFLDLFGDLNIPNYLGKHEWNQDFIDMIKRDELEGMSFEGVVGKNYIKNQYFLLKAKTQKWIDKVLASYDSKTAESLINS